MALQKFRIIGDPVEGEHITARISLINHTLSGNIMVFFFMAQVGKYFYEYYVDSDLYVYGSLLVIPAPARDIAATFDIPFVALCPPEGIEGADAFVAIGSVADVRTHSVDGRIVGILDADVHLLEEVYAQKWFESVLDVTPKEKVPVGEIVGASFSAI